MRRLTDHVLTSLTAGLAFAQDEPNGPALWASVRVLTATFLLDLHWRGALQGVKPQDAFFVRCGLGDSMSEADVTDGVLVLTVGLAVLRPAEFEVHSLRLPAGMPSDEPAPTRAPGEPGAGPAQPPGDYVVRLPHVVSRYIGETEKNLRKVLGRAVPVRWRRHTRRKGDP